MSGKLSRSCHRGFWAPQVLHFARRTCAKLGIARPVLVGHSLGGLVALEFAAAHPQQVAAVVMIDSVLLPTGDRSGLVRQLVAALRVPMATVRCAIIRDVLRPGR